MRASLNNPSDLSMCRGLRVLLAIDEDPVDYPPTINAARVLASAGAQVLCLGGRRGPRPALPLPNGARIEYADFGPWESNGLGKIIWGLGRYRFRAALLRIAREFAADLMIAYDQGAGWAALPLTERPGLKTVLHIHDNENLQTQSWLSVRCWQWAWLARNTDAFSACAVPEQMRADHLRDAWNIRTPFQVVANAAQLTEPKRNRVLREHLGMSDAAGPLAVMVGIGGMLPEIVRALARTRMPWHVAIIGCRYESAVDAARAEAVRLGVHARTHFLPHVDYDTMRIWLQGCDVGFALYPSAITSLNWQMMGSGSVKVMEYMGAGIPSIVCSREAFARLQTETHALELLATEDVSGVVAALDLLEPGSDLWSTRSEAAIRTHRHRYNYEQQLGGLLRQLYPARSVTPELGPT